MQATLSGGDVTLRLALAVGAGVLFGLDRGGHAHPAGLRTNVLICVAAALAMLQANALYVHTPDTHSSVIRLDLMRLPLGILSGIGFIGAGAILRHGEMVRGVTTAATIWLVTVLGLCFGGGQIGLGITGTAIGLATLWLLRYAETGRVTGRRGRVAVTFHAAQADERDLMAMLRAHGMQLRSRRVVHDAGAADVLECSGRYRGEYPAWSSDLTRALVAQPGVSRVEWRDID